jgi:cellulose synthase/poly-beta-1,6-N-acetylglucosamine synthase-like glycosyltransferase
MPFDKIIYWCFLVVFVYCAASVAYLLVLSLAGRLLARKRMDRLPADPNKRRIAVLVPAYKEDGIILSTAQNLLQQQYPADRYRVYILADSFQPETVAALSALPLGALPVGALPLEASPLGMLPLEVLEVAFEKSTKTKSLNEAFRRIAEPWDIALICDADNMLAPDFLERINAAFGAGARAVQGRRVAKNLDTSFAVLDACSEGINNHIFRKGTYALGLSSSIIGSGMAYEYDRVRRILSEISAVGGFDKILQLMIVKEGIRIHYLEDALVFDEKVDNPHAFEQQRKRWLSSQFIYLRRFFGEAFGQLFRGNLSFFNLAVMNNLILPRAFLFALLPLVTIAGFFISRNWGLGAAALALVYGCALLLGIPREVSNKDLGIAVIRLPKAVLIMVRTIFKLKNSNKTFIHTVHTKTEISNSILKEKVR